MMTTTINSRRKGFTLAELLVAMGITAIILTLLVLVTGVALDGWRISRNKVRASRQAKAALDQLSRDFESMVVRSGNEFEWLFAKSEADAVGPTGGKSPNAARLIFFSAATDRYDGKIDDDDSKGDVSAVGYGLFYTDPIAGADSDYSVFALYRQLVNPDVAFEDLLAKDDLTKAFGPVEDDTSNFLCENIYQISVVFMIEFTEEDGGKLVTQFERVPILAKGGGAESVDSFRIRGTGIRINGETEPDYARGRVISVDLSVSVITDAGIATMRKANFSETDKEKFLAKNTYNYIKTILLPQP